MLGRQVGSSMLRLPANARLVLRPALSQYQQDLISRTTLFSTQRYYASTPGRPKKAVGEPSRPVKRSVKRAAKSSATGEAGEQVAANKRQSRAKKTTAKKAAAPKKPKKKVLTDKQKAVKEAGVAKAKIADLKKAALDPPKRGSTLSTYTMFMSEKMKEVGNAGDHVVARQRFKENVNEWKRLSPAELEHYNHLAQQERQAREAEYQRWLKSHTPEQIQLANRARAQLKRKLGSKKRSQKYQQIKDERLVKPPVSAYIQFSVNRHASGDFHGIRIADRAKLIAEEWKALNESEKKKYKDLGAEEHNRYVGEYHHVYGHDPPVALERASAAA